MTKLELTIQLLKLVGVAYFIWWSIKVLTFLQELSVIAT